MPVRPKRHVPQLANTNGYHAMPAPPVLAKPFEHVHMWLKPKFKDEVEAGNFPNDWYFLYWKNHPMGLRRRFFGTEETGGPTPSELLKLLVTGHNGWTIPTEDGTIAELPQPTDDAFWDELPLTLTLAMLAAITDEIAGPLPNSPMRMLESLPSTSSSATPAEAPPATLSPGPTSEAD